MTIKQQGGIFGRNPTFNQVNVDDGGKIVVGTDGDLEIYHSGTQTYIQENGTGDLRILGGNIRLMSASGDETFITCIEDDYVALRHNNNEKLRTVSGGIDVSGNVILDSGSGIDFSATSGTGTSELFDDYEEGSYTVSLHDGSSSGNASSTTTTGYYTKVGQVVTCSFAALNNISTAGMTTSNVLYMSLPFSAAQSASGSMAISVVGARQAAGAGYVVPVVVSGNSRARFYGCQSGNATSSIRPAELTSGTSDFINFTMTYIAS